MSCVFLFFISEYVTNMQGLFSSIKDKKKGLLKKNSYFIHHFSIKKIINN